MDHIFECDHFALKFYLIFGIDGFVDLYKHDFQILFSPISLFCLIFFIIDIIMWIFLPLYFVHPTWGQGLKWEAHVIALSYMTATHAIEYFAVQIAYSNIGVKWSFSRFYHPLKSWIFGFLLQIDFYSDIAMTREIYKCSMVKEHSLKYLVIYLVSLIAII